MSGRSKPVRLPRAHELVALADTAMQAKHSLSSILNLATQLYESETTEIRQKMLGAIRDQCEIALARYGEPE